MNNLFVLNKETYEVINERVLSKNFNKDLNANFLAPIIDLIKDLEQMGNINTTEYVVKIDAGKIVGYAKSKNTNLSVLVICDKKSFKRQSLIEIARIYLEFAEKEYSKESIQIKSLGSIKIKDFLFQAIEELTNKFIENLRNDKLYTKMIYYNYNTNVASSMSYKKSKAESTSVILFNSNKEQDKNSTEQKDTMLQRSTIKEKELNLELEKKQNHPTERRLFIRKFNNIKSESLKKKYMTKNFNANFFIEKHFLTKNTMIHYLFNNVFIESPNNQSSLKKENLAYPINADNEHLLLYLLDIYDKSQELFAVSKTVGQEYVDIVNYIELNLNKPEVMLTKSKLILIKYKNLFVIISLEIFEDRNIWSSVNNNTNFYKEIESLFYIAHNEMYNINID